MTWPIGLPSSSSFMTFSFLTLEEVAITKKCERFCTLSLSVRRARVAEVRRWLDNYQKLKGAIETICELNHELLRPEPHRRQLLRVGKRVDGLALAGHYLTL